MKAFSLSVNVLLDSAEVLAVTKETDKRGCTVQELLTAVAQSSLHDEISFLMNQGGEKIEG